MSCNKKYELIELEEVNSTSLYLKKYCSIHKPPHVVFCTTKKQTHGYGQQQRSWMSNSDSLVFSMSYPFESHSQLSGLLSLQVAAILHKTLSSLTQNIIYLKWPNDLYTDDGKVAGVLIEQVVEENYHSLVIGVGINQNKVDGAESSGFLSQFDSTLFFDQFYELVQKQDLFNLSINDLRNYWSLHDFFEIDEPLKVVENRQGKEEVTLSRGFYKGIADNGLAKLSFIDKEGVLQEKLLSSGLSSMRKL